MQALRPLIFVGLATVSASAPAQVSEIYKCIEPSGRSLYTSDKRETVGRKCELVSRQVNVVPGSKGGGGAVPRETQEQRARAAERQRAVLQQELATEEKLLEAARKSLAEQENIRTGDEKNYARVLERLQPYKDSVETHQKNVDALKRELVNFSR